MLLRFFRLIFEVLTEVEKHEKDNSVKFIPSAVKDLSDQFCVVFFFSALVPCSVDAPYQGKDFEDRLELKLWNYGRTTASQKYL